MTTPIRVVLLVAVLLTAGCRADFDGDYAPGCMAFAGSNIELRSGRFVWDQFTDQIEVGADGNPVDPFPDYPISGSYTVEEQRLIMTSDDGRALEVMHVHEIGGSLRLLTQEQNDSWAASGSVDECSLARQPTG